MKHLFRIAFQLFIKFSVCLPLSVIGIPILVIGLLFVDKNATTLPKCLKWFDNADDDGLIGDVANQERNRKRGIDPNGYLAKLLWLGFRNKLNYFKYRVIGLKASNIITYTVIDERPYIKGQFVGNYHSGGTRYIEVLLKNGFKCYEYYLVWPYHLFNKPLCVRIRLGWKIGNPAEPDKKRDYKEWADTINPFCPYLGYFKANLEMEEKLELVASSPQARNKTIDLNNPKVISNENTFSSLIYDFNNKKKITSEIFELKTEIKKCNSKKII
ncbi:MAG: hypothetical protein JWM09_1284 [Francisellaceae bacterium]|nr:hypothetical protein [Francisellaceae bacterium]